MKSKDLKPGDKIVYRSLSRYDRPIKAEFVRVIPAQPARSSFGRGRAARAEIILHYGSGDTAKREEPFSHLHPTTWEEFDATAAADAANEEAHRLRKEDLFKRWAAASFTVERLGLTPPHDWSPSEARWVKESHLTPLTLVEELLELIRTQDEEITRLHEVEQTS